MKIWLVTIGSSDVQLRTNDDWGDWYRVIRKDCHNLPFEPAQVIRDSAEPYRIAPRVLGIAYQAYPDEIWNALEFPLLKEFSTKLKDEAIDQIILLTTDQSCIFDENQRDDYKCPYWQDTSELQPILERYFQQHFPAVEVVLKVLAPQKGEFGLDDWNFVLDLVRSTLKELSGEPTAVYISHQAGTPAISSAVQFCSLARFRANVEFVVSNEYCPEQTRMISRSTYLRGLQTQEAKALLERYDYSGVKAILAPYLQAEVANLLEAAIQWNYAKFDKFAEHLQQAADIELAEFAKSRTTLETWWWTAYESAYLGFVRLKQGNTVEAMFHSFRSVEGLLRQWSNVLYGDEIKQTKHPRSEENQRWDRNLNAYGEDLYWFLTVKKSVDVTKNLKQNTTPDIFIFGNLVFKKRNDLFHQLKGLEGQEKVFENWQSPNEPKWKQDPEGHWKLRVLKCLNFICEENFSSLEEASLLVKVHQKIERAIAQL